MQILTEEMVPHNNNNNQKENLPVADRRMTCAAEHQNVVHHEVS